MMYVCMYLSMYLCIYVSMYVPMYVPMYVCTYVCIYLYRCIYVCMNVCMHAYMHVCMYICMYVLTWNIWWKVHGTTKSADGFWGRCGTGRWLWRHVPDMNHWTTSNCDFARAGWHGFSDVPWMDVDRSLNFHEFSDWIFGSHGSDCGWMSLASAFLEDHMI